MLDLTAKTHFVLLSPNLCWVSHRWRCG